MAVTLVTLSFESFPEIMKLILGQEVQLDVTASVKDVTETSVVLAFKGVHVESNQKLSVQEIVQRNAQARERIGSRSPHPETEFVP